MENMSCTYKKPRYREDDRAMRPIYECHENCMQAQNQPTIAQEYPHYNPITIRREIIFEAFQPM